EETVKKYGSVSPQVAQGLAKGIRKNAGADIGIGVTGIAGPGGGTKTKPIGLVYIALAVKNKTICKQFNFSGTRLDIKLRSTLSALNMLRCELL
ncbi:MAG: nicotinamide-nucleotide amidohydrolase family protein, partial [Candidatus Omnitrophica bacterium]|nr:nicotinamide-nucleotide amidohydrolase family protein [Candidatus Omnitrophota bacterium]